MSGGRQRQIKGSPPGKRFFILRSQGASPPGFYLLREGWVYRPAPEAPQKGECRRDRGHFWKLPDACGLRTCTRTHHKKALCHTCPFGGAGNKYRSPPGKHFLLLSFGLRGPFPQAFTSFGRVGFIARRLRHPKKGECRRGRGHFWKLPDACGLRLCTRTHHKKGLVPYLPVWWGRQQIPLALGKAHLRRNPSFCAVAFTLPSGVGPTSRGRSAFLPPT